MKKKLILLMITVIITITAQAQWLTNGTKVYYNSGNVGIGTNDPLSALEIIKTNTNARISISASGTIAGTVTGTLEPKYNGVTNVGFFISANSFPVIVNNILRVSTGGVTIGSSTGYSLTVDGKVGAREVIVSSATPWPDYVFNSEYRLMPLSEVKKYIQENNHLPEVPAAAEVEANGQNIGEINTVLLKKIEELTLYLIEQDAKIRELQKAIETKSGN